MLLAITELSMNALNPETGDVYWSHDLKYPHEIHANVPIYRDDYVFAMNGWGFGSVMLRLSNDGNSITAVWRSSLFDLEHGDVILIGNNIYGSDWTKKHFWCVDWLTGKVKDSLEDFASSVISADRMIYAYNYLGKMHLIKPEKDGFELVITFEVPTQGKDHIAMPVIYDGKLYLRHGSSIWVYNIEES